MNEGVLGGGRGSLRGRGSFKRRKREFGYEEEEVV